jgi:hypothetical protein
MTAALARSCSGTSQKHGVINIVALAAEKIELLPRAEP